MQENNINKILIQIARANHTTVAAVRKEIEEAMRVAQSSHDPVVQSRWKVIPHKGTEITVEEFIMYMIKLTKN